MIDNGIYEVHESPLNKIMETDIRYTELQQLCEILLVIPVTAAAVKRSFSAMNRVLIKTSRTKK